jgi:DNA-binding transcriptional ArsR family regulator
MLEHYKIETLEQLRTIADVRRLRIVDLLREQPLTVTQLGERIGEPPAKVHYHVRELEKVGLLRLVETREKGGILEKYYQAIAREISVPGGLLLSAPSDETMKLLDTLFQQIRNGLYQAIQKAITQQDEEIQAIYTFSRVYLTPDEVKRVGERIGELLKPFEMPRGLEGEREMLGTIIMYPEETAADSAGRVTGPLSAVQEIVRRKTT